MPIRINLLAEAQAAAELRRKNPVKRAVWVGAFLALVVALWAAKLQLDITFEQRSAAQHEADWKSKMVKYTTVTNEQAQTKDVEHKLAALDTLSTNRFLWAPVMNALQQSMVDQVQVVFMHGDQTYQREDGKFITSGTSRKLIPGAVVEKINLSIEAKDLKPIEQNYTRYKEKLCSFGFFSSKLERRDGFVMDGTLGPLTIDPIDPNKQFVTFMLTSHFPEVRRSE